MTQKTTFFKASQTGFRPQIYLIPCGVSEPLFGHGMIMHYQVVSDLLYDSLPWPDLNYRDDLGLATIVQALMQGKQEVPTMRSVRRLGFQS